MAKWVSGKYGSMQTATLAPGMTLFVCYDGMRSKEEVSKLPYKGAVFGESLPKYFETEEQAKAETIRVAKSRLWLAMDQLESLT